MSVTSFTPVPIIVLCLCICPLHLQTLHPKIKTTHMIGYFFPGEMSQFKSDVHCNKSLAWFEASLPSVTPPVWILPGTLPAYPVISLHHGDAAALNQ